MKTRFTMSLAALAASLATLAHGAPPVVPPQGGTMAPSGTGGVMTPTAIGGTANASVFPNNLFEPVAPLNGGFNFGPPGGTVYLNSYGYYPNPAVFGAPGAMLNGNGVGGIKSTVIVPGSTSTPGSTLNRNGVGGVYGGTIVSGGGVTRSPGGTLGPTGVGGNANGVIVTGGGTTGTTTPTTATGTSGTPGSSVIVTGGSNTGQ